MSLLKLKRFIVLSLISLLLFLAVNVSSFTRSYFGKWGLSSCSDCIVLIGFPFNMVEYGGCAFRFYIYLIPLTGNILLCFLVVLSIAYLSDTKQKKGKEWRELIYEYSHAIFKSAYKILSRFTGGMKR